MFKGLFKTTLTPVQKICLSGLFIAIVVILQKVIAINYIPIVPFLRISLGGPAIIIFSSIFLGPIYGMLIGAASDVVGYFLFDPKSFSFFPQITAIYTLLGLVSGFVFYLFKRFKKDTLLYIITGVIFAGLLAGVTTYLFLNDNLQLYGSSYTLELWQKILIPSLMLVLLSGLYVSMILINKKYKKENLIISPASIFISCFIIEISIMVIFGTLMKGLAFGFQTYPMILICQIIVLFINVPLNCWLLILLFRITYRFYKRDEVQL